MTEKITAPLITTLPDGKICDFIDGMIRNDTPEEYVRQNIERRLVKELGYKPERIAIEFPIKVGSNTKRVDIVIFPDGALHKQDQIDIIIECKHEKVKPSDKKDGEGQLKSYLSSCPNAQWGMWTNGRHKSVFRRTDAEGRVLWEEPNDIPAHDGNVDDTDRPTRERLMRSTDDNLLFSFRTCHDHIYITDGLPKDKAFAWRPGRVLHAAQRAAHGDSDARRETWRENSRPKLRYGRFSRDRDE